MRYNIEEKPVEFRKKGFSYGVSVPTPELTNSKEEIKGDLLNLLRANISRRIPLEEKEKFCVLFGVDELFAGYERHKRVSKEDVKRECLSGLLEMHERDLYRDAMVAKSQGISLRAPFLASELVDYALKIPIAYKLSGDGIE